MNAVIVGLLQGPPGPAGQKGEGVVSVPLPLWHLAAYVKHTRAQSKTLSHVSYKLLYDIPVVIKIHNR